MIEIANLLKQLNTDVEIRAMQESIPEWRNFEDGMLKDMNEVTSTPLVKDPKLKIESLFDDNNEFKFHGFKPVPRWVFLKQNKDDPIGEEDNGDKDEEPEEGEDEDDITQK